MDQSQIQRYVSRFEPLFYVPAFTQKDFHEIVHTGLPTRELLLRIWVIQTRSTQLLSLTNTTSTKEARYNNNHIYT